MNKMLHHKTVMIQEVLEYINLQNGNTFLDATIGAGGHSKALLDKYEAINLIGLDKDIKAVMLFFSHIGSSTVLPVHAGCYFKC